MSWLRERAARSSTAILLLLLLATIGGLAIVDVGVRRLPQVFTELPVHHLEGWTLASFRRIALDQPLYGPISEYASSVYPSLPYYLLDAASRALGAVTHLSEVGNARLLSFVFPLFSLAMLAWLTRARRALVAPGIDAALGLVVALAAAPAVFRVNNVGPAFPHAVGKAFLFGLVLMIFDWCAKTAGESPTKSMRLIAALAAAPWFRQTFVLVSAPLLVVVLIDLWRGGARRALVWACGVWVLTQASILLFIARKDTFAEVAAWTIGVPGHHPRGFQWMLEGMPALCLGSLACYGAFSLLASCDLRRERAGALVILGVSGCGAALFHSMKQGSGSHMADTIVYPMVVAAAAAIAAELRAARAKRRIAWAPALLIVWCLSFHRPQIPPLTAFTSLARRMMAERDELFDYAKAARFVSLAGPIEGLPYDERTPIEASLLETTYTDPRMDGDAPGRMDGLFGPRQFVLTHRGEPHLLYLPARCRVTGTRTFALHHLQVFTVECNVAGSGAESARAG